MSLEKNKQNKKQTNKPLYYLINHFQVTTTWKELQPTGFLLNCYSIPKLNNDSQVDSHIFEDSD